MGRRVVRRPRTHRIPSPAVLLPRTRIRPRDRAIHRCYPTHRAGACGTATQWAWTDSAGSWSWNVAAGTPLSVEVYADADEVELILNGTSLGRLLAGRDAAFRSTFTVPYAPGQLVAIAYSDGRELGRSALRSAHGLASLETTPDRTQLVADDRDL